MALFRSHPTTCRCSTCGDADRALTEIGLGVTRDAKTKRATEGKVYEARIGHSTGYHAPEARPLVKR